MGLDRKCTPKQANPFLLLFFVFLVSGHVLTWYFLDQHVAHSEVTFHDFPGGSVVKNLPCNAGDAGSIPGQGTKIPRAVGQLSPSATTTEPSRHN